MTATNRLLLAAGIVLFAGTAWFNASATSFDPMIAPLKLLAGVLHLVVIGGAFRHLLHLERPKALAFAHDALLGQVVCLAYVYLRSAVCNATGAPGISSMEVFGVEAALVGATVYRTPGALRLPDDALRKALPALVVLVAWLGWLVAIAGQKLDLLYTPSSDPDIHAYYVKAFLERGHIYYDLLPDSDAWMVYPSGFATLNFIFGRLSGLHPVQLVNIAPYLQLTLFAGAGFSALASTATRRLAVPLAVLHFGVAYLVFNAVFGEHRMFLEGTPRLAHTALLFFPLFFVLQHHRRLTLGSKPWSLPFASVAVSCCINPTHAPAALLVGFVALLVFSLLRDSGSTPDAKPMRSWPALLGTGLVVSFVILSSDPFYQSLAVQQSIDADKRDAATDLTGAALSSNIQFQALLTDAIPVAARTMIAKPKVGLPTDFTLDKARLTLLAVLSLSLFVQLVGRRLGLPPLTAETKAVIAFSGALLAVLVTHGVWAAFTPHVGRAEVLQSRLLMQYSLTLQQQINLLFFSLAPTLIVCMCAALLERIPRLHSLRGRTGEFLIAGGTIAALVPYGQATFDVHRAHYYAALRTSPLGYVYPTDLEFIEGVVGRVGDSGDNEERVLLPGRLRRAPSEHWVFTTDVARALPLYTNVKTSFFLGLDGAAFTAGAYDAHVHPPNFDADWLRAADVVWLVDSGNFPPRILKQHYTKVFGNDHAVLWRLRD